jgi:hypothetical protein
MMHAWQICWHMAKHSPSHFLAVAAETVGINPHLILVPWEGRIACIIISKYAANVRFFPQPKNV